MIKIGQLARIIDPSKEIFMAYGKSYCGITGRDVVSTLCLESLDAGPISFLICTKDEQVHEVFFMYEEIELIEPPT